MLMRAMIVIAVVVVVVMVLVRVRRPRGKRVREVEPCLFASSHFVVAEQATIELTLQRIAANIQCHHGERLSAIAERLLPFLPRAYRHFGFTGLRIARRPPMTSRHALEFRAGEIKAADFFHSRSEPEKTFSAKNAG